MYSNNKNESHKKKNSNQFLKGVLTVDGQQVNNVVIQTIGGRTDYCDSMAWLRLLHTLKFTSLHWPLSWMAPTNSYFYEMVRVFRYKNGFQQVTQ